MFIKKWNGKTIKIKENRYTCVTDMDNATGKSFYKWRRSREGKEYLEALSKRCNIPIDRKDCLTKNRRNTSQENTNSSYLIETDRSKGTYVHPKLALRYAQYCSAELAVTVDFWLYDELTKSDQKTLPFPTDRHTWVYRPLEDGKAKWEKTFFEESFDVLYALDDRQNKEPKHQHPPYIGKLLTKYFYDELSFTVGCFTSPKQVVSELKTIKTVLEEQGIKGIKALHQMLGPEGRKVLEKTVIEVVQILKTANMLGNNPKARRACAEFFLQNRRGQTNLPILQESVSALIPMFKGNALSV